MASYTGAQLEGQGTPIEALTAGTEYIFTVTPPSTLLGSAYFTFETVRNANGFYDSTTVQNAVGTLSSSNIPTLPIQSPYIFSEIISPGGNTFSFTPTNNVAAGSAFLRGTGGISLAIAPATTPNLFSFRVRTNLAGSSNDNQFRLPLIAASNINATVNWGDGQSDNITSYNQSEITHTYSSIDEYNITIDGVIDGWQFSDATVGGDKVKIQLIEKYGTLDISTNGTFSGCTTLNITATDAPTISSTDLSSTFFDCTSLTAPDFSSWDVSNVTSFSQMFRNCTNLTAAGVNSIAGWDVGSGQLFSVFMRGVSAVGSLDLSSWDITSATDFEAFLTNGILSTANYDALLISWAAQSFIQNAQTATFGLSTYTGGGAAAAARATLEATKNGWNISDGGVA